MRRILGESLETHLLQTKDVLDVVERMLTDSSGTGFGFLNGFEPCADGVSGIEILTLARHHGHLPVHRQVLGFWPLVDTAVSRVGRDLRFFAVQEFCCLSHIMNVGGCGDEAMGDAAVGVNANVDFPAKLQLVAFLDLMHLGISMAGFVLGRIRGFDDGGNDDGVFSEQQTFDSQQVLMA